MFWIIISVIVVLYYCYSRWWPHDDKKPRSKRTREETDEPPIRNGSIFSYLGLGGSERNFNAIRDRFTTLEQVTMAIRGAGLESSNLIFGVDFTKSNLYQGETTYRGRSLHAVEADSLNPYQQAISVIGRTLETFDDDGLIPAFGFGDASTRDQSVFPFRADGVCHGFRDVLDCYNAMVSEVRLSGPTSFAPLIRQSIDIVRQSRQFHILVIVADGQVTEEEPTVRAIVEASHYALSIVMVGVGDGPWDTMRQFDDRLPRRQFDNFQFVNHSQVMSRYGGSEAMFALQCLMEIPDQYKAIRKLGLLSK